MDWRGTAGHAAVSWRPVAPSQPALSVGLVSLHVSNLGPEVTDQVLLATFQAQFPAAQVAKIITDPATGLSKGYGFVRFASQELAKQALAMHGQLCGSSRMRVQESTAGRGGA